MTDPKQVYILHPGKIRSINDGNEHYIGAPKLAELYGVTMTSCKIFDKHMRYNYPSNWIHLWPRYNGDYTIPEAD